MARPWDAAALRSSIDTTLAAHAPVGAPATWLLSNHDVTRPVTRYGRADSSFAFLAKRRGTPSDLELGNRRARAAALLCAALPGSLYIYQGDELGPRGGPGPPGAPARGPDVPPLRRRRSRAVTDAACRCRGPATEAPFGFSPAGATAETWLRQPDSWAALTVEAQHDDPGSMLSLYRASLRIRRDDQDLHTESMRWLDAPEGVLAFARGSRFVAITNLSPDAVALPVDGELLLASAELEDGRLPSDASAWIRLHDDSLARGPGGRQGKRDEEELMTAEPLGWGEPQRCDPSLDPDEPTKASRPE